MKSAFSHLSDDELLTLAQNGQHSAFAELMSRTSASAFHLAITILKDREEAEDEVQNSFWNAWRFVGQFQRGCKFSTWLSRIVINQCLMRLRQARKARFLYLDEGIPGEEVNLVDLPDKRLTPEKALARQELYTLLHREIRRLPPLLRSVLVMRDLDEVEMDEVARTLGISVMAAKSRLLRARLELRQRMMRHCGSHPPASSPTRAAALELQQAAK